MLRDFEFDNVNKRPVRNIEIGSSLFALYVYVLAINTEIFKYPTFFTCELANTL